MEKNLYNHYTAADFVLDDDFIAWVRGKTPHREKQWEKWLSENPEKVQEVDSAREILLSLNFASQPVADPMVDREWELVRVSTLESNPDLGEEKQTLSVRPFPMWARLLAASVLLVLTVWIGANYLRDGVATAPALSEKKALNGQQLTVRLNDGTVIVLNGGSTLSYPEEFPADKREVKLTGEAYFEVAPNPRAPFLIMTDEVRVEVIGTKFIVKAYPENREVKVAVVEGKVAVNPTSTEGPENSSDKVLLVRDEMATIGKENRECTVTAYDKNDLLGWKNGILYFQKSDFPQLISKLERWYGVQIDIDEGVGLDTTWRFSGKFENKSIDYILDVCRYPDRFTYKIAENKVVINK